jgi:hypothetical protein
VSGYHTEPALWAASGTDITRIGVVCHEIGHAFGLPDLYDTDYTGSGIGSYCLMANSWGFDGSQLHPPHMSAWCKMQLGWVRPTLISPGAYSIQQAETIATLFQITNGYPAGESLLIENRQPIGFENDMPLGGLAIWHIDENKANNNTEGYPGQIGWPENGNHYKVSLLQADGRYDLEHGFGRGDFGDLYRAGMPSEIGPTSVPSTDCYQDGIVTHTQNIITRISASGSTMTFVLAIAPPTIRISRSGTTMIVRWPSWANGYVLQSTPNMNPTTVWTTVSQSPALFGDEYMVTVPAMQAKGFFRLLELCDRRIVDHRWERMPSRDDKTAHRIF